MSAKKAIPITKKSVTVNEARTMLVAALGNNSQKYFKHLQEWFKLRTNKEVIDNVARRCLKHDKLMQFHDLFILTLLNKVGELEEESLNEARQTVFPDDLVCPRMSKHYQPVLPDAQRNQSAKSGGNGKVSQNDPDKSLLLQTLPAVNVAQDVFLPSPALMHGRLLLASWQHGLRGVHADAAELVLRAMKTLLKNVLTAIINDIKPFKRNQRSHLFHVDSDASVMANGIWWKERFDQNSLTDEEIEKKTLMELDPKYLYYGHGSQPHPEEVETTLTASNVIDSLLRSPKIIPPNSIYSRTIERASLKLRQMSDDVSEDIHPT